MALCSERCNVSLLDNVIVVIPVYMFLSEAQSPNGHFNSYPRLVLPSDFVGRRGGIIAYDKVGSFKFVIVNS